MKMMRVILVLAVLALIVVFSTAYVVDEREQVFITQFGQPVGKPVTEAGIHFKLPFVQKIHKFDKRILEWDGNPNQVPTKDKKFIEIDTYARWRIADPLTFFQKVTDELGAQSRLDDILDGSTRSVVAGNGLVEIVRSQQREAVVSTPAEGEEGLEMDQLPAFQQGRSKIADEILQNAKPTLAELGIELIDIRFKRINYSPEVQKEIFNRMTAERQRIADKFRSEGEGEAAKIEGQRERELKVIDSGAYRQAQEIKGKADAEAIAIYAKAFNQSQEARDFYRFIKTLETYETGLTNKDRLILSTDSELFQFLHRAKAKSE